MTPYQRALNAHIEHLRRSERDLAERLQRRAEEVDREGGWLPCDPIHQRLYSVLMRIREQLRCSAHP